MCIAITFVTDCFYCFYFRSKCRKTNKQASSTSSKLWRHYLEDLKQSNLTCFFFCVFFFYNKLIETESRTPFVKNLLRASVPPGAESDFWPTMPSREQRGYKKSDPGGDHCYVGCLGQTRVSNTFLTRVFNRRRLFLSL